MHRFFIKIPHLLTRLFPAYRWHFPRDVPKVYLSFDDGPHPQITGWVLDRLQEAGAKATFFCIGENVVRYPEVFRRIVAEGHVVGNHSMRHLNGWKSDDQVYVKDVLEASEWISSRLFRPPYGRIRRKQAHQLKSSGVGEVVMWDVLSADFDRGLSAQECMKNVIDNMEAGSIVVFHDSEKAERNLKGSLPGVLEFIRTKGWEMAAMEGK